LLKIKEQGVTILAISENELKEVSAGDNFFAMLRDLYERERLDLPAPHSRNLSKRKKMRSSKRLKD